MPTGFWAAKDMALSVIIRIEAISVKRFSDLAVTMKDGPFSYRSPFHDQRRPESHQTEEQI